MVREPADRFAQLPESTREWLEQLREEDIQSIHEATKFYHDFKGFGKISKWIVITIVAIFITASQFSDAILKLLGWIRGGRQ